MKRNSETYGAKKEHVLAMGVPLLSAMLLQRMLMSRKKSLSGKKAPTSVMKMKHVLEKTSPQKPYCLFPIHDHKRRDLGGLLSQLLVHAERLDAEELEGNTRL
jgi:hypothetical protein